MKKRTPSVSLSVRKAIREKILYKLKSIVDSYAVNHPTEAESLRAILDLNFSSDDVVWQDGELAKVKITNSDLVQDYLENKLVFGKGFRVVRHNRQDNSYLELSVDVAELNDKWNKVFDELIIAPYIDSPEHESSGELLPFTVTSMNYTPLNHSETHVSSSWEIATDKYFTDIVKHNYDDTVNLVTWDVSDVLQFETTYYVRCKHKSASYESEWGLANEFTMGLVGIAKPSITSPDANSTTVELSEHIISSPYTPSGIAETHESTDWQISTDINFNNLVYDSAANTTNLTQTDSLSALGLNTYTTYYVRCRYHSASHVSKWSDILTFTTIEIGIERPNIVAPSNGAVEVQGSQMIQSSPYNGVNQSEVHDSSDWQIATDSDFTNIVVNVVDSTTQLTEIGDMDSLGLSRGVLYFVRVRYQSTTYTSEWSAPSNFTLAVQSIAKPIITSPSNDQTDVDSNDFIIGSNYTPVNHTEPHESTDWEIATDSGFTNIVVTKNTIDDEKLSIGTVRQLGLLESTEYYVRCKYNSASFSSAWSDGIHFTTEANFTVDEVAAILADNAGSGDKFGYSVSANLDGKVLAVGAPYGGTSDQGSVYILKWNGNTRTYDQFQELTITGVSGDQFGYSVNVSDDGETIIAAAPWKDNVKGTDAGTTYVFKWNSGTNQYEQIQELIDPNSSAYEATGWLLDMSGDASTIVIANVYDDVHATDCGSVAVWKWDNGTNQYVHEQRLSDANVSATAFAGEGLGVSNNGEIILVGNQGDDYSSIPEAGSASVFKWNSGTSQYDLLQYIRPNETFNTRRVGLGCAMSDDGEYLFLAAPMAEDNDATGKVYVLKWNSSTNLYDHVQHLSASDPATGVYFSRGICCSNDGHTVICGANNATTGNGTSSGALYVFKLNTGTGLFEETTKKITSNGGASDYFGAAVGISGDSSVIIGCSASYDNAGVTDVGSVYIFK